ncbi:hypothetical protein GX411_08160, partial [Candidatus Fermentibacteria bacterium]|nr:hypothetical protein [Candidatus Fermentibacteria bacterium]
MNPSELCSFFLQLAVLLGAALVFGRLSRLLGMPSVIGEIAGGILVGKTLLGRISPETFSRLFSPGIAATSTDTLIRLGMLFFMFAAGFEINLGQMKGKIRSAVYTGVLGLIIPMALGFFTVLALPDLIVSALTCDKAAYEAGEVATLSATVRNAGATPS